MKNDYQGALSKAQTEGKLVFVSFTGYACTNCHWMKANMFPRAEVQELLKEFVLVELYTDGNDAAAEEFQKLQDASFASSAIPLYAIVDGEGKVLAQHVGLTKDTASFTAFIKSARKSAV
jgi:thiol:disulfide interchange protein DsbD